MNSQDSGIDNEHICGGTPDDELPKSPVFDALETLLDWAMKANSRLTCENSDEGQFGGNPYLNPVFKKALAALEGRQP